MPAIVKILRYLKRVDDTTANPLTHNVHTVCDLAIALAPAIVKAYVPNADAAKSFPGTVPLPSSLYSRNDAHGEPCKQP